MKTLEIDRGRAALLEVVRTYSGLHLSNANEAETRKKVIDRIIENVLGWQPCNDISYEETVRDPGGDKFSDYVIRTATTGIIVEAKRLGKTFDLPNNRKAAKLGGFLSAGDLGAAIAQAREYAFKLSVPFAVATNGSAWVVFPALRTDGIKWEDTEAHIFRSLEDIKDRFVEFWELLSRQRVIEGNLENTFFGVRIDNDSRRLLAVVRESGFRLGRNSIYEHIESAVAAAFTDEALLRDREGLEYCYVKSSERIKYDSRLRMHLADAKPLLDRRVSRPRNPREHAVLDEAVAKSIERPPQFLLVLGPVGAGKTTFLEYTKQVSARATIDGRVVWLYVDFKRATESDLPRQFIFRELLGAIETDEDFKLGSWDHSVKYAYKGFIDTAKNGFLKPLFLADPVAFDIEMAKQISKDRELVEPYVERILTWTKTRHPVFLVIDNVDQFEREEFQRDIFIEAQAGAKRMGLNVIMSLRDATYLRHRNSPSFDAFQVDSLYIDAPQTLAVLSRRFTYAKKFLEGKSAEIRTESGVTFRVTNLAEFLSSVSASLLSEKNGYLIEILAGGDLRRALNLVREFLSSGHTSSDRVLWAYAEGADGQDRGPKDKRLAFPRHEIFKACVLGQRRFYREEDSLLPNIFDSKLGSSGKQLLRIHLLAKLVAVSSAQGQEGILVESIHSDLYQIGVSDADVGTVIRQLIEFRAIRTGDGRALTDKSQLLPTRLGGYLVRDLAQEFAYVELCTLDTNIFSDRYWLELKDLTLQIDRSTGYSQLALRCKRAKLFVEYIKELEEQWTVHCRRFQLSSGWDEQIIGTQVVPALNEDVQRVINSAAKKIDGRRREGL